MARDAVERVPTESALPILDLVVKFVPGNLSHRSHWSADELSTLWVSSLISLGAQVNGVANSFAEVQYRQPNHRYIHHRVKAIYNRATKKVDVTISGSKFPTHSVFVNGELRQTVKQGDFAELWQLDDIEQTLKDE